MVRRLSLLLVLVVPRWALANDADFAARCARPGVLRCVGFDAAVELTDLTNNLTETIDTAQHASGAGSLRFTIESQTGSGGAGWYKKNFSDDYSVQFGEGEEFYVQWRQRFSPEFINTYYDGGGGWKQIIIGAGDLPGCTPSFQSGTVCAKSCTQLEVVVQNTSQRGLPQMYHSCGVKDGQYQPLEMSCPHPTCQSYDILLQNAMPSPYCLYNTDYSGCFIYHPDEWMTFQVRVKIGTWYLNDSNYHYDSTIQLWVARDGQPSQLVIDRSPESGTGYDLVRVWPAAEDWEGSAEYGKLWLLPYHTGKDDTQVHPTAYTWYDELIVSTEKVPDPTSGPPDTTPPAAPANLVVQ